MLENILLILINEDDWWRSRNIVDKAMRLGLDMDLFFGMVNGKEEWLVIVQMF